MKKDVQIKTIVFDLGNVLLNYDARKAAKRFAEGCEISILKVWAAFFVSSVEKAYTRGEISTREFYQKAKNGLRFKVGFQTFRHYWTDIFWENPGMESLVKKLKRKYPLYLISNTNQMHFDHIKKTYSILEHFKKTFPSHKMGARKPEIEIYKRALAKIPFEPHETVFIDDMPAFVRGAKKAGMNAIHFKSKEKLILDLKKLGVQV